MVDKYYELLDEIMKSALKGKHLDREYIEKKLYLAIRYAVRKSFGVIPRTGVDYVVTYNLDFPGVKFKSVRTDKIIHYRELSELVRDMEYEFTLVYEEKIFSVAYIGLQTGFVDSLCALLDSCELADERKIEIHKAALTESLQQWAKSCGESITSVEIPIDLEYAEWSPDEWPPLKINDIPIRWTPNGYEYKNGNLIFAEMTNLFELVKELYYGISANV